MSQTRVIRSTKRQSGLRFEVLNAFVDGGMPGLSRGELAVWLILYRDTKPDGTARTSLDDLARRGRAGASNLSQILGGLAAYSPHLTLH